MKTYFSIVVVVASVIGTEAQTTSLVQRDSITTTATTLEANDQLLIAAQGPLIHIINLDPTGDPTTIGSYNFSEAVLGLSLDNHTLLVANSHDGLKRLDLSEPADPKLIDSSPTRGQAVGVASSGGQAFVADNSLGFDIVTTAKELTRVGEYLADGFPRGIASSGTLVFVADQPNGLVIVDVTAPTTPEVVAVLSLGSDPITRVIVPDQTPAGQSEPPIACIVSNQAGLQVIDLSDPKSPRVAAPVATRGQPRSVAMQNNQVYVISENTLEVFDLSNPGLPVLLASQSVSDQATQVAANEEMLFVATPEAISIFERP
ncbi:MAG: hypothetical protein CL484_13980 [Acidobacteria bacterium]|nr:hypothetical protein [Acidobacteriota bacterium]